MADRPQNKLKESTLNKSSRGNIILKEKTEILERLGEQNVDITYHDLFDDDGNANGTRVIVNFIGSNIIYKNEG